MTAQAKFRLSTPSVSSNPASLPYPGLAHLPRKFRVHPIDSRWAWLCFAAERAKSLPFKTRRLHPLDPLGWVHAPCVEVMFIRMRYQPHPQRKEMGKKHSKLSYEELQELVATTHFSSKDLNKWYRGFLDDCPSGSLNKEEFCKIFHKFFPFGETSDFAGLIFNVLDSNSNGVVGFKEFINSLSATAAGTTDERLKWLFQLYDTDRDGYIGREEVEGVVSAMHRMLGRMTSLQEEEEEEEMEEQETLQERVANLWELMDKDKIGKIDVGQFINGCKRDPGTVKALALYEGLL